MTTASQNMKVGLLRTARQDLYFHIFLLLLLMFTMDSMFDIGTFPKKFFGRNS